MNAVVEHLVRTEDACILRFPVTLLLPEGAPVPILVFAASVVLREDAERDKELMQDRRTTRFRHRNG